jgi:glutathione synthase/RimK-type ligase-like ATP-grasp enzyme
MAVLIVVENRKQWPIDVPGTEVVRARDYLTEPRFVDLKRAKVFNLCKAYGYQSVGYYVSLLAAARGHKPLPSVTTIQDLRVASVIRIVSEDLEARIQRALSGLASDRFVLSIYFGRNLARKYDRLCASLFNHFPAPLLRAEFARAGTWRLQSLRPIASGDIPENHRTFVLEQAQRFFDRPRTRPARRAPRYALGILVNPEEVDAPSDPVAIRKFARAAKRLGIETTVIGREDFGRLAEYDALFIRETTAVNHHTYRFARRAEAEGMVVIDDPESIVRCTNKVYLAEVFARNGIPAPRTVILHRDNSIASAEALGFPLVLKRPDSSFSSGVVKVSDPADLEAKLEAFLAKSDLVVAQEYAPSEFDWRVGVLDGRALYVCKYHMVPGHWQVQMATSATGRRYGKVETLAVEDAPREAVVLGERAAALIGRGLYGVDIKEVGGRFVVMEINDNPNLESGCEDKAMGDALYDAVMLHFYERLEARGRKEGRP